MNATTHQWTRHTVVDDAAVPVPPSQPQPTTPSRSSSDDAATLFAHLADLPAQHPARPAVRGRLIEAHLPLARHLARRFNNRGEPLDDLLQVACVGLIKAIDGYDPQRLTAFGSYAVPMILGELKRHFRDKTWKMRVPRTIQELWMAVRAANEDLTQQLHRSPTVRELAQHLDVPDDDVVTALAADNAYQPLSLDAPVTIDNDTAAELADMLGTADPGIDRVDNRLSLRRLIARLPERERRILHMRFFDNMTQSQIGAAIGMSQMHVSRLLSHALGALRVGLLNDPSTVGTSPSTST